MSFLFLKSKKFLIILVACILVLAPSSYVGASYYQSNKLVKEAAKLEVASDYAGAISKYDQALKKWKWNDKKISPKKITAEKNIISNENLIQMTANFGKGEWQKCLDYLANIDKDFPQYSQAQNRYSDCQKKLEEQNTATVVAAKKAEDDRLVAEATTNAAAAAKAKADAAAKAKTTADAAAREASSRVNDAMFVAVTTYCKGTTYSTLCKSCVSNNGTCKAEVDKIVQSMQDSCNDKYYLEYYSQQKFIDAAEANCKKCLADPVECMKQYNEGA